MKDYDASDGPQVRVLGKEFIILIVIVFSSISFALGYFVGKNNVEKRAGSVSPVPVSQISEPVRQIQPIQQAQPVQQNQGRDQLQSDQQVVRQVKQEVPAKDNAEPADRKLPPEQKPPEQKPIEQQKEGRQPETQKFQAPADKKATDKMVQVRLKTKDAVKEEKKANQPETDVSAEPKSKNEIYTVQLGALKNKSEADKFKAKYTRKGYKIYIAVTRGKRHDKIYKIRTGRFKEKKDAEALSEKFRNEGLKAFVTSKDK